MRYEVTLGGRRLRVERDPSGALTVDDRVRAVDATQIARDLWTVTLDGRSVEVAVLTRDPLRLWVSGDEVAAEVANERELALGGATRGTGAARQEIRAPMPGLLKALHVREGDRVERGASLATLEAMKMENELRAPDGGTVSRIAVAAGAKVEGGALLLVLTP
ncbi:MAG: biotin/lipoyl-binding protein [Chloroflexi bacterium]|nr:biotin/lipoyl-binding protein [Chloroflexota bacterium]